MKDVTLYGPQRHTAFIFHYTQTQRSYCLLMKPCVKMMTKEISIKYNAFFF